MISRDDTTIAIIGAGIGGLAAGLSLRRQGFDVEIYEQAPQLRELGAAIGLRPRTVKILQEWGLQEQYASLPSRVGAINVLSGATGKPMGQLTIPSETNDPTETWSDMVHRGDLHGLLSRQIPERHIHLGHKCQSVKDQGDHVEIAFTNGQVARASAIIAADGIHSALRPLICEDRPVYSGLQGHRGVLPMERVKDLLAGPLPCTWALSPDGGPPFFLAMPIRGGTHVAFDALLPGDPTSDESWRATISREAFLEKLRKFGFASTALEFASRIETPDVSIFGLFDRDPIANWTKGRMTLLGDAAHPMLPAAGQGANQAIQDAYCLADCLHMADASQLRTALQHYASIRAPITNSIQIQSRESSPFDLKSAATA